MRISVTDAKGQLTDLVRRAEAGDEVILTRHGQPAARLVAIKTKALDPAARRQIHRRDPRSAAPKQVQARAPQGARTSSTTRSVCQVIVVDTSALIAIVLDEAKAMRAASP